LTCLNTWKKVEAIIGLERLDDVKNALAKAGFKGLTVAGVKGKRWTSELRAWDER